MHILLLGRLFRVDLIKPVSNVRPYVGVNRQSLVGLILVVVINPARFIVNNCTQRLY